MKMRNAGWVVTAVLMVRASAALACESDVECKADRICENRACVDPPATQLAPIPAGPLCHLGSDCRAGEFCVTGQCRAPEARPEPALVPRLAPPFPTAPFRQQQLVMRSVRLRNAGMAFVALGTVSELVAFALVGNGGFNQVLAGTVLFVLGLPMIANGAWMWPVGAALVPRDDVAAVDRTPTTVAVADASKLRFGFAF